MLAEGWTLWGQCCCSCEQLAPTHKGPPISTAPHTTPRSDRKVKQKTWHWTPVIAHGTEQAFVEPPSPAPWTGVWCDAPRQPHNQTTGSRSCWVDMPGLMVVILSVSIFQWQTAMWEPL